MMMMMMMMMTDRALCGHIVKSILLLLLLLICKSNWTRSTQNRFWANTTERKLANTPKYSVIHLPYSIRSIDIKFILFWHNLTIKKTKLSFNTSYFVYTNIYIYIYKYMQTPTHDLFRTFYIYKWMNLHQCMFSLVTNQILCLLAHF